MPFNVNAPKRKRILVVDDEPDVTLLVRLNLQRTGRYEVQQENRASRALSTARVFQPDLILLDIMMPEMDGGDVLAQLRDDANLRNVPVMLVTATVLPEELKSKGGTIGGHPCIAKPFQTEVLLTRIDSILSGGKPTAAPR